MGLHWLKTRWRTRGEYGAGARRLLWRFGVAVAGPILLVAVMLFALFWILGAPSRSGAREVRIDGLADSIVAAVERGRLTRPASLEDLIAAGVLTKDDVDFLADEKVAYYPIHGGSPDTAVVFRRTNGGVERVHRRNGTEDYYTAAVSPDGGYQVVVGPPNPRTAGARAAGGRLRSVTLRALAEADGAASSRLITTFQVPEYAAAHWSSDSRFVAVEARPPGDRPGVGLETFVLAVSPTGARRLDLPAAVRPEALLAPADRTARLQSSSVRVVNWRGATLLVASEATGWIGPPGEERSRYVSVACRIGLEVSAGGVREIERRC